MKSLSSGIKDVPRSLQRIHEVRCRYARNQSIDCRAQWCRRCFRCEDVDRLQCISSVIKELFAQEDEGEKDPYEAEAEKYHLNFIKLDGNIGCMVNGAGLAMSTMDIIKYEAQGRGVEASPANFLDVGGSAKHEQIKVALELISKDPNVEVYPSEHLWWYHELSSDRRGCIGCDF